MAAEQREKLRLIDDIYRSVLEKDIAYLLKLDKPDVFSALIKDSCRSGRAVDELL